MPSTSRQLADNDTAVPSTSRQLAVPVNNDVVTFPSTSQLTLEPVLITSSDSEEEEGDVGERESALAASMLL